MNRKIKIYQEIKHILMDFIVAMEKSDISSFDYDMAFNNLLIRNDISFNFGIVNLLYNIVDTTCDSINHSFREVNVGYSYMDVKEDIKFVINCIENNRIDEGLEKNEIFLQRIKEAIK